MDKALWYKNAVFYEVYVRAFGDGNGDGIGDFRGLTARLDYFRDLGVDVLWLQPIYPSPLVDDGYDIADHYGIHPDLGTLDDFKTFLAEAHARGLRVIADLVLNHTSDRHPWFQSARSSKDSPFRDYYVWSDTDRKYADARIIFLDTQPSNWTYDPVAGQYFWHRFYAEQPDLNYDNPAVQQAMLDVMKYWLDLGLDGFRADAVPYLFERDGTNCENLPETHAYLQRLRAYMQEHYPGRILLAEANQWPRDAYRYFGDGDEFHMAFHFPLMPRIYIALAQGNAAPVVDILTATPEIPATCQWCTFLRNHDELTLEMVTPGERDYLWWLYAPLPRMRLNLGIRRRLAPLLGGDPRRIALANALLFALPGSPVLYYGDEIGMGDNIWLDDRDGVRTPMQWDGGPNAGFSGAPAEALYAPPITDEPYAYTRVNVAAARAGAGSLWHRIRRLITVRKEHDAFGYGGTTFLATGNSSVLGVVRTHGADIIVALHNLSADPQDVAVDLSPWRGARLRDLIAPERAWPAGGKAPVQFTLEPYEYVWLKVEPENPKT